MIVSMVKIDWMIVDDLRRPSPEFIECFGPNGIIATTSAQAIDFFVNGKPSRIDNIFLDHDLGGDETIAPFVNWLDEEQVDCLGHVYIVTSNPVGANTIRLALRNYSPITVNAANIGLHV